MTHSSAIFTFNLDRAPCTKATEPLIRAYSTMLHERRLRTSMRILYVLLPPQYIVRKRIVPAVYCGQKHAASAFQSESGIQKAPRRRKPICMRVMHVKSIKSFGSLHKVYPTSWSRWRHCPEGRCYSAAVHDYHRHLEEQPIDRFSGRYHGRTEFTS